MGCCVGWADSVVHAARVAVLALLGGAELRRLQGGRAILLLAVLHCTPRVVAVTVSAGCAGQRLKAILEGPETVYVLVDRCDRHKAHTSQFYRRILPK